MLRLKHHKSIAVLRLLQSRGSKGFSLIEVLMSLVLLGICLSAILPMFYYARVRLHESDLKAKASAILDRYQTQILDQEWESIGSDDLILGDEDWEWYIRHKVSEQDDVYELPLQDDVSTFPPPNDGIYYLFDLDIKVYYDPTNAPETKIFVMEISYTPYLRPLNLGRAADPNDRIIVRTVKRAFSHLQVVEFQEN